MPLCRLMLLAGVGLSVFAQAPCNNTPAFTPCEFAFDLNPQEAAAHPNPYVDVELSAEFRSPHFHTFKLTAFWDGGQRLVIRFTPTEAGEWLWRVSSNVQRWEGQSGAFTAAESDAPGFVRAANVHHWAWTAGLGHQPHLWMGDTLYPFAFLDQALFQRIVDARAAQRFNHLRGLVLGTAEQAARIFPSPDRPNPEHFQHLDQSIRYMNQKGIVADLIVAGPQNQLARLFPNWQQRRRYIGYIVERYAGMNVTWQGVQAFETYDTGRALMKEIGGLLKQMDPYQHPRTSGNLATSGALMDDGWMDFVAHHTGDDQVCAIEHQLFSKPFVDLKFAGEDSGAGKSQPDDVDRSEEHTSELQSLRHLVCRLLLEKKKKETSGRCSEGPAPARCNTCALRTGSTCAHDGDASPAALDVSLLCVLCRFFFFLNNRAPPEISPFPLPAPFPF